MDMDAMFVTSIIKEAVLLKPRELGSNYKEVIQQQLRMKYEGVCNRHGFVMPGTVALARASIGRLEAATLNGDVRFEVYYNARLCNPAIGSVIQSRVVATNKFGILTHAGIQSSTGDFLPVMEAIIAKQGMDLESEVDLEKIKPGDLVAVEIIGKKFELNDDKISVIGRVVSNEDMNQRKPKKPSAGQSTHTQQDVDVADAVQRPDVIEVDIESESEDADLNVDRSEDNEDRDEEEGGNGDDDADDDQASFEDSAVPEDDDDVGNITSDDGGLTDDEDVVVVKRT